MCSTCGCEQTGGGVTITKVGSAVFTPVTQESPLLIEHRDHEHYQDNNDKRIIQLEQDILHKNNKEAEHNRSHFELSGILAINLVSSPGSGKTTLLEITLRDMQDRSKFYVIEGDQQTMNDANRIAASGCEVVQINTGKGCHLDANMVHRAIHQLNPAPDSVVFIENVGNLVCPAMFDLGETFRVAIISVTEGDDKPIKYPDMFASSDLCIINKTDLLPYVNFSIDKTKDYARKVNPKLSFIMVSATTGEGTAQWYAWLKEKHQAIIRNKKHHQTPHPV